MSRMLIISAANTFRGNNKHAAHHRTWRGGMVAGFQVAYLFDGWIAMAAKSGIYPGGTTHLGRWIRLPARFFPGWQVDNLQLLCERCGGAMGSGLARQEGAPAYF